LRFGSDDDFLVKTINPKIKAIDQALEKASLPEDVTVFRAFVSPIQNKIGVATAEEAVGGLFIDHGFVSTSVLKSVASSGFLSSGKGTMMEIRIKAGAKAASLLAKPDNLTPLGFTSEAELLLHRSASFRIINIEQRGEVQYVMAEYVGPIKKRALREPVVKAEDEGHKFMWEYNDIEVITEAELKDLLVKE